MNIAIIHGSPRIGNTRAVTEIVMRGLRDAGAREFYEFALPEALPEFCTGCQACLSGPFGACPHAESVAPILAAILAADALVFATPVYARDMSGGMKNLLDHLDFLTMTVAPRRELFGKRALILTTGAGSTAAIRSIRRFLRGWGLASVGAVGVRLYTDRWDGVAVGRRARIEARLRRASRRLCRAPIARPNPRRFAMYYQYRYIIRKFIGEGNYPYEHWRESGFFDKRPF